MEGSSEAGAGSGAGSIGTADGSAAGRSGAGRAGCGMLAAEPVSLDAVASAEAGRSCEKPSHGMSEMAAMIRLGSSFMEVCCKFRE